jgi:uncharacterized protein (TIGR04255 family)
MNDDPRRATPERVMPPTFPKAERIELQNPPLDLVVCQLRFPIALGLVNNQPPEAFHRAIHSSYPVARRGHQAETLIELSTEQHIRASRSNFWLFEDKDAHWTVSLGADFLSLETRQYRQFDEFVGRFLDLTKLTEENYGIELRDRLGLRYIDRVSRARQPFLPENWVAAINPHILPLRHFRGIDEPQMNHLEARFSFGPKRMLTLHTGFFDLGFPGITENELILDFDCYTEQRSSLDGIRDDLFQFKETTYNAFRWAFGDLIQFFELASTVTDLEKTGATA